MIEHLIHFNMKNIFTKIVIACDFIDRAIIRCALEKAFFCGFALSVQTVFHISGSAP